MEPKIVFATGNENKMKEIRMILADLGMPILSMKEASLVKAQEHIDKLLEIIGNLTKGNNNG